MPAFIQLRLDDERFSELIFFQIVSVTDPVDHSKHPRGMERSQNSVPYAAVKIYALS